MRHELMLIFEFDTAEERLEALRGLGTLHTDEDHRIRGRLQMAGDPPEGWDHAS